MIKNIAVLILFSAIIACQNNKNSTKSTAVGRDLIKDAKNDTLSFKYETVKVYSKAPVSINKNITDTAKATITYPLFEDPTINDFVQNTVLESKGPEEPLYTSYQAIAEGFIKKFEDYKRKNKEDQRTWFKDIHIQVLPQRNNYLGLKFFYDDFVGGAHGSHAYIYKNYNPMTHQLITLDTLIKSGAMPQLTAIAEKIFRTNEKLSPEQSLKDLYFFNNDVFALNQNFTITDKGLKFLYNPYEIKAYVYGITELFIPFKELKDILKPNPVLPAFQ